MISFTWDPRKDLANQRKHGVSFEEASTVFLDENALLYFDPDHSNRDEERYILVGFSSSSKLLLVVHCYIQSETVIRIISARNATNKESNDFANDHRKG